VPLAGDNPVALSPNMCRRTELPNSIRHDVRPGNVQGARWRGGKNGEDALGATTIGSITQCQEGVAMGIFYAASVAREQPLRRNNPIA